MTPLSITIFLNDRSFEYDVYTLVIAFFQGVPTKVLDPVERNGFEDARDPVQESHPEGVLGSPEEDHPGFVRDPDADRCLTIEVLILPERICLSIHCPAHCPVRCPVHCLQREIPLEPSADRGRVKNLLKRSLYEMLREICRRDLPWGSLTGIRPVKLAMQLLEDNGSGTTASGNAGLQAGRESYARQRMQELYFTSPGKADLAVRIAKRERSILSGIDTANGYSLYIGIPFCPSICLYCSFSSSPLHIWKDRVDEYLDALLKEMRSCRECFPGKTLHTVYIGGGTPTTLTEDQLDRLLDEVEENFDLSGVMEYTVEAGRPDSITRPKLEALRRHPVTRVSVNPQTMNQKTLDLIGRAHTVEDTVRAYDMARSAGFDNINMDLIVGLPGEGPEEVDTTMRRIEELDPDDVTVHALALKRAARLALHMDEYEKISFQASDQIMERCEDGCRSLGMTPYYLYRQKNMAGNFENVGYAKDGKAGLYNILIMEEVECILALGASGSTKIVHGDGRIERIENVKDIRNYLERTDEMISRKAVLKG